MACNNTAYTLGGLNVSCKESSLGGIRAVYVGGFDDIKVEKADGKLGVVKISLAEGASKMKKYTLLKNSGNLVSELQTSDFAAPTWQNSVVLQFPKMNAKKRNEVMALLLTPSRVVVEDANGTLWLMGKDNYVDGTAGSGDTGTNSTDNNHYELTLQDISAELPFEVESVTGLVDDSVNA